MVPRPTSCTSRRIRRPRISGPSPCTTPRPARQLQTDQQFPTLGSQDKGIKTNADGSIDIYFAPKAPEGQEGNWLQTIPGKSWFIALRIYGPEQSWIDQTWRPGGIEVVG